MPHRHRSSGGRPASISRPPSGHSDVEDDLMHPSSSHGRPFTAADSSHGRPFTADDSSKRSSHGRRYTTAEDEDELPDSQAPSMQAFNATRREAFVDAHQWNLSEAAEAALHPKRELAHVDESEGNEHPVESSVRRRDLKRGKTLSSRAAVMLGSHNSANKSSEGAMAQLDSNRRMYAQAKKVIAHETPTPAGPSTKPRASIAPASPPKKRGSKMIGSSMKLPHAAPSFKKTGMVMIHAARRVMMEKRFLGHVSEFVCQRRAEAQLFAIVDGMEAALEDRDSHMDTLADIRDQIQDVDESCIALERQPTGKTAELYELRKTLHNITEYLDSALDEADLKYDAAEDVKEVAMVALRSMKSEILHLRLHHQEAGQVKVSDDEAAQLMRQIPDDQLDSWVALLQDIRDKPLEEQEAANQKIREQLRHMGASEDELAKFAVVLSKESRYRECCTSMLEEPDEVAGLPSFGPQRGSASKWSGVLNRLPQRVVKNNRMSVLGLATKIQQLQDRGLARPLIIGPSSSPHSALGRVRLDLMSDAERVNWQETAGTSVACSSAGMDKASAVEPETDLHTCARRLHVATRKATLKMNNTMMEAFRKQVAAQDAVQEELGEDDEFDDDDIQAYGRQSAEQIKAELHASFLLTLNAMANTDAFGPTPRSMKLAEGQQRTINGMNGSFVAVMKQAGKDLMEYFRISRMSGAEVGEASLEKQFLQSLKDKFIGLKVLAEEGSWTESREGDREKSAGQSELRFELLGFSKTRARFPNNQIYEGTWSILLAEPLMVLLKLNKSLRKNSIDAAVQKVLNQVHPWVEECLLVECDLSICFYESEEVDSRKMANRWAAARKIMAVSHALGLAGKQPGALPDLVSANELQEFVKFSSGRRQTMEATMAHQLMITKQASDHKESRKAATQLHPMHEYPTARAQTVPARSLMPGYDLLPPRRLRTGVVNEAGARRRQFKQVARATDNDGDFGTYLGLMSGRPASVVPPQEPEYSLFSIGSAIRGNQPRPFTGGALDFKNVFGTTFSGSSFFNSASSWWSSGDSQNSNLWTHRWPEP